jgi:hypothetical protein
MQNLYEKVVSFLKAFNRATCFGLYVHHQVLKLFVFEPDVLPRCWFRYFFSHVPVCCFCWQYCAELIMTLQKIHNWCFMFMQELWIDVSSSIWSYQSICDLIASPIMYMYQISSYHYWENLIVFYHSKRKIREVLQDTYWNYLDNLLLLNIILWITLLHLSLFLRS